MIHCVHSFRNCLRPTGLLLLLPLGFVTKNILLCCENPPIANFLKPWIQYVFSVFHFFHLEYLTDIGVTRIKNNMTFVKRHTMKMLMPK